jgi:hypothetical protein
MGTDLRETNLSTAKLIGAKYDRRTKFPVGFDPAAVGMLFVDEGAEIVRC